MARKQPVRGHIFVAQGANDLRLRRQPLLVGVEHVEGRAGAEPRLLGNAFGRNPRGVDLFPPRNDRCPRHEKLREGVPDLLRHAARFVLQLVAALIEQRLGLANHAVVQAPGIERHRSLDADLAEGIAIPAVELGVAALDAGRGAETDLRPFGREGAVEIVDGDPLAELGRYDPRVALNPDRGRLVQRIRHLRQRRQRLEVVRHHADRRQIRLP